MAVAATGALRPLPVDDAVRESEWMPLAACRGAELDLFFPVGSSGPALNQLAAAKAICGGCLVRADCLSWAMATGQQYGVWGGLSEEERHRVSRDQRTKRRTGYGAVSVDELTAGPLRMGVPVVTS